MAKSRTTSRSTPARRQAPRRRPPTRRSTAGPVVLAGVAVVVVIAVVVWLAGRNDNGGSSASASGGLTGPDFHSLVADPANPDRLFVGGHQAVSESVDGGRTWTEIASLRDADAMGWGFAGDAVYVSGHPGLNRSTDGGQTFERVNTGLPNTDVHAFGGSRDALYGAATGAGVFTGTPGDWQVRTSDAGPSFFGRIVVDAANAEHLLAADAQAGVVESSDGGRSWRRLNSGLQAATWVSANSDLSLLVASGPAGAARSDDGGRTWHRLELPDGASLVEVAADGSVLYAGRHNGTRVDVLISRDGGQSWTQP
jgi:hypothetical protein